MSPFFYLGTALCNPNSLSVSLLVKIGAVLIIRVTYHEIWCKRVKV